jgi:CHAD domain-containing protein
MGQIVIEIPNKTTRRYNVEKADDARKLLRVLDELNGVKRNSTKLTREQMHDLRDGIRATRILAEMHKTGESYSVEDLRQEFGLS